MKFAATAIALAAALLAAGCGGGSSKSGAPAGASTQAPATTAPPAATTAPAPSASPRNTCLDVPTSLEGALQAHLVLAGGRLSHLQAVTTKAFPDYYFVSARIDGAGAKPLLATWVAEGLAGGGSVYSVDATAALVSLYGGAIGKNPDLTVEAPGAYKSRVCVAGPGAPRGSNAPVGAGKGAPAGQ